VLIMVCEECRKRNFWKKNELVLLRRIFKHVVAIGKGEGGDSDGMGACLNGVDVCAEEAELIECCKEDVRETVEKEHKVGRYTPLLSHA